MPCDSDTDLAERGKGGNVEADIGFESPCSGGYPFSIPYGRRKLANNVNSEGRKSREGVVGEEEGGGLLNNKCKRYGFAGTESC